MRIEFEGKQLEIGEGKTIYDIFQDEIKNKNIIACRFNNDVKSLDFTPSQDGQVELLDISNKDGMRIYIRGLLFIMGMAFEELYPDARLTVNYQMFHSMLCEVDNMSVTTEMIEKVNKKMQEIIKRSKRSRRIKAIWYL